MKRLLLVSAILLSSLPTLAVSGSHVKYLAGTAPGVKSGVIGTLDTTSDSALVFDYQGKKLSVPYKSIESFRHSSEVARHLGALPALFIALVKARQKRHFFRIAYCDQSSNPDSREYVVILEVPKGMAPSLESVLVTRAPQRSRLGNHWGCWR